MKHGWVKGRYNLKITVTYMVRIPGHVHKLNPSVVAYFIILLLAVTQLILTRSLFRVPFYPSPVAVQEYNLPFIQPLHTPLSISCYSV